MKSLLSLLIVVISVRRITAGGIPTPGRPFEFIWQVPSGKCSSWDVNFNLETCHLDFNARGRYHGHSNAIFYHFGKFPHRDHRTEEIVNGGVPQLGNMTLHLLDAIADVNDSEFLPVCNSFDGACPSPDVGCSENEYICVEVDANNDYQIVDRAGKWCQITDTSSPMLNSWVCGYKHLQDCVPISKTNCGLVDHSYHCYSTLNMEWWRMNWNTHWGPDLAYYTSTSLDLMADIMYPDEPRPLTVTQSRSVKDAAIPWFEDGAELFAVKSLELGQRLRPNCKWGYYHYPYCFNAFKSWDFTCTEAVQEKNNAIAYLWKQSDCLKPSTYMYQRYPRTQAFRFHYAQYCEAIRCGFLEQTGFPWPMTPDQVSGDNDIDWKCIVPYTTYKHTIDMEAQTPPEFYNEERLKITLRLSVYFGFEASYIWGASADTTNFKNETTGQSYNVLCEILREYTSMYICEYARSVVQWAEECSEKRCTSHGRCTHYGALCNDNNNATAMFALDLDNFDTSDQANLESNYFCKCDKGWKGRSCELPKP